jgi:hypothetical protein
MGVPGALSAAAASLSLMARWRISRVRRDESVTGSDLDVVYAIHYAGASQLDPQTIVGYLAGAGTLASEAHARDTVKQYRDDDKPPRRLLVGTERPGRRT